jgi:outer membrane protein assembly factor BamB
MFSSLRGRGGLRWIVLGGVLLLVAAGAAAAVVLTSRPGDVSHPDVEFTAEQQPTAPPAPPPTDSRRTDGAHPLDDGFSWPVYGYTKDRRSWLPLGAPMRPPFVQQWAMTGRILLEFTPVLCGRSVFLMKNNGALYAVSRLNGRVRWKRKLGYLAASAPACGRDTVYAVLLARGKGVRAGRVVAVDARTGRTKWSQPIRSRVESSPLVDGDRLYFGSEDGTVYALRASDGAVRWRYRASGAVKGGLALDRGRLYFGDYGGNVQAIRQRDGGRIWRTSSAGSALGLRAGRFYATPAVAYGRVYIGSLDGFVYSLAAGSGRLAWRHRTGNYVYSSAAVASVAGVGPTVYVGSYDGRLYAFDARSGRVRWTHNARGKISGGATVVGDLVFYSNLSARSTGAVGARTGRLVWRTDRGAFNPVISDGRRLYLNGYSSLFMLSTPEQARRDSRVRLRDPVERRKAINRRLARAERAHKRTVARRVAVRKRKLARRVAARQRQLRRNAAARRAGRRVCFTRNGRRTCRVPRPLVCVTRADDRTVCRPREGKAGGAKGRGRK